MKLERDSVRNLRRYNFRDNNNKKCSIQESSAIEVEDDTLGTGRLWLGVDRVVPTIFRPDHGWSDIPMPPVPVGGDVCLSGRMHLNQSQVAALLPYLEHFATHGLLPDTPTNGEADEEEDWVGLENDGVLLDKLSYISEAAKDFYCRWNVDGNEASAKICLAAAEKLWTALSAHVEGWGASDDD